MIPAAFHISVGYAWIQRSIIIQKSGNYPQSKQDARGTTGRIVLFLVLDGIGDYFKGQSSWKIA